DRDAADSVTTSVTASNGAASISTLDLSSILADAGGLALAISFGEKADAGAIVSVGIAVALNTISNTDEAFIDRALVSGQSGVAVTSPSDAPIDAVTLAGALDVHINVGDGLGLDLTGAGAGAKNVITNTVSAYITDSAPSTGRGVRAPGGDIQVAADDSSTI